jgi:hypothetical protein
MSYNTPERAYRYEVFDYSHQGVDWLNERLEFGNDALLKVAYAIAEWIITYVGPMFWICLAYLFFVAQSGHWM